MLFGKGKNHLGEEEIFVIGESEIEVKEIGEIIDSPKFEDVVFDENQKEFIKLAIKKMKTDKLNLLFSGFAGTGKTYSSKMIACETQKPFVYLTGSMGKSRIVEMLQGLKPNALVLIDEIHNMSERVLRRSYGYESRRSTAHQARLSGSAGR